jgi:hypothetical protein
MRCDLRKKHDRTDIMTVNRISSIISKHIKVISSN